MTSSSRILPCRCSRAGGRCFTGCSRPRRSFQTQWAGFDAAAHRDVVVGAQRLPQIPKRTVGADHSSDLSRLGTGSRGSQASKGQRTCRRVGRTTLNTGYSERTLSSRRSHVLRGPAFCIPNTIAHPVGRLFWLVGRQVRRRRNDKEWSAFGSIMAIRQEVT